jgi:centromere protein C
VPEEEVRSRSTTSKGKGRPKPKKPVVEEEYEEWEVSPGTVEGEIVIWETEHEEHPPADDEPVQVTDERIAISAKAVQTSEIRDATFRFAKTLTMPFMGAGVVDLPPGGEKRPKNSRKMHMVFFVHTGKVMVTINEAQFRISAGGMWFVPRGELAPFVLL